MRIINVTPKMDALLLGKQGENKSTKFLFDVSGWLEDYPGCTIGLNYRPAKSDVSYPCILTDENYGKKGWLITSSELVNDGDGQAELVCILDEVVEKDKRTWKTKVNKSLGGSGTAPDPWENWEDTFIELAERAEDAAEDAEEAKEAAEEAASIAAHAPIIQNGYWYEWDATTEQYVNTEVKAQGEDGDPGQDATPALITVDYSELTFPVAEGKLCYHSGLLYKANQAIATSEAWTAAHWTQTTIEAEQSALKTAIAKSQPTATDSDIGKFLKLKSIDQNGKPKEFEYGSGGGGGDVDIDKTLTIEGDAADAKAVGDIVFGLTEIVKSKNLYNKAACNPQNGKWYKPDGTGVIEDSSNYAITGKIPVEAQTKYAFTTSGLANIKRVFFFKGDSGETYISNTQYTGKTSVAFETPALCTFIGFSLFAASHTSEQYTAAIDKCQLELGTYSTDFVPYSEERKVSTDKLVDETAVEGAANVIVRTPLINWYDKSQVLDNKYFNNTYQEIYDNTSYAFTGLIPVKPNTQYNISCDKTLAVGEMASFYEEWDESRSFIQRTNQNGAFPYISQIHTGATTKYISMNLQFGAAHTTEQLNALIDSIMLVEGTQIPASYVPYSLEPVADHKKLDNMYQLNMDKFRGKKWLVCGTSISYQDSHVFTGGVHENEVCRGYIGNVARNKPMIVTNEGISGSTLADTTQDSALINRYQDLNFANYDFITLEYGVNDFGRNITVGTENDAAGTGSFAACLKTIIEYALTQNPLVGLIVCTEPDVRGTTLNTNNNTLKDYTDVTLAIAKQYRLPVCDWYYYAGFNPLVKGDATHYYLTADGTHPSDYGHMRMGAMLNQVFDSLLC